MLHKSVIILKNIFLSQKYLATTSSMIQMKCFQLLHCYYFLHIYF